MSVFHTNLSWPEAYGLIFIGLTSHIMGYLMEHQLSVESLMTKKVVTVEMDDSLETIGTIFRNLKFHHLAVIEENRLVGIISDRDYLKALSPHLDSLSETTQDRATLNKRAYHIMSHHPISISKETSIESATQIMLENGISCLPVTDSESMIQGIITWRDLIQALLQCKLLAHSGLVRE